jgi:hypothetical protein
MNAAGRERREALRLRGWRGRALSRALLVATAMLAASAQAAPAQTRFEAHYNAYLALLPLTFATGTMTAKLGAADKYVIDLTASGLGFGLAAKSEGHIAGRVMPTAAAIDTRGGSDKRRTVRMAMRDGTVFYDKVQPPLPPRPRVPISAADRRGVLDPISALLMPMHGTTLSPSMCARTLPIFEGTERFDIVLSYLRTEQVTTAKGYRGPVLVCRARYRAISGHRPGAKQVTYMEHNKSIEAWLAPVAQAHLLVPWRVSVGTLLGTLVIEADRFHLTGGGTPGVAANERGDAKP